MKLCDNILTKWGNVEALFKDCNADTTVQFMHFEKVEIKNKRGEVKEYLKTVQTPANAEYLLKFMSNMLVHFIHHRNLLKHYRSTIKEFYNMVDSVDIDVDFSENLTLPVKHQAQSLHWSYTQVTVHSGIVWNEGEKSYHPYFSDNRKHDQVFVKMCIKKMLKGINLNDRCVIIESDNCRVQYKSNKHVYDLQQLSNELNSTVLRIYSIPGHGKGEVDHVGGIVKVAVRREIAAGRVILDTDDIIEFLREKFGDSPSVPYVIEEVEPKMLEMERAMTRRKNFSKVDGISKFQVMVFVPFLDHFKASDRLCICQNCQIEIGSCCLFRKFTISADELYPPTLRSKNTVETSIDNEKGCSKKIWKQLQRNFMIECSKQHSKTQ